mgnify:CR=1 FL=1
MEKAVSKKEEKMAYKEFKEHLSKNELLQAQSCLKKHSKSNDTFAYQLGKLLLENYDDKENIDNGIKILSEIAEKKDSRCYDKANYRLGKYYEDIGNSEKAEVHLLRSAEDNNVYAMYKLGKAYLKKNKETMFERHGYDLVLLEGFKDSGWPKIEVVRREISDTPVSFQPLAVVGDIPDADFGLEETQALADWLVAQMPTL